MQHAAHRSPGIHPAINSAATEAPPPAAENTINAVVGGISCPTGAVAILTAAANPSSYFCSFSSGSITPPIAVAAAIPEPEIEPNIAFPAMFVSAKDPGTFPRTNSARLINLLAIPPLFIKRPARIKNGTAIREKLSIPLTIFCAETNTPNPGVKNATIVTNAETMMLYDTGTLNASIRKNTITSKIAA